MDKVREALESNEVRGAIGRFRGVRDFFDIGDMSAESDGNILADAIEEAIASLTQPQPEAREEDIERAFREFSENGPIPDTLMPMIERVANELGGFHIPVDVMRVAGTNFAAGWLAALSRLTTKEGQSHDTRERRCDECRFFNPVTGRCQITLEDAGACSVKYGHSLWTPAAPATSEMPEEGKR